MKKVEAGLLPLGGLPPEERDLFTDWACRSRFKNDFDAAVLTYPRTVMCRATRGGKPLAYVPLQPVLMFESLVPRPGGPAAPLALGLLRIWEAAESAALDAGFGEMYFLTNDEPQMLASSRRGWTVALHDEPRGAWLMKRRVGSPRPE